MKVGPKGGIIIQKENQKILGINEYSEVLVDLRDQDAVLWKRQEPRYSVENPRKQTISSA